MWLRDRVITALHSGEQVELPFRLGAKRDPQYEQVRRFIDL
jgi:hypothetical protein